ncbi:MAG: hypothetical protein PVJ09_02205 [Candidatus Woesebacteria bacterium]|jgi:hypothetical protein
MNPALKTGLARLVYLTFLHNSDAIALFLGIILALVLLLRKPRRVYVFFLLAFVLLLARFEYLKHVVDPLQEQTVTTVIQEEGHHRAKRWFDVFFNDFVPMILYLSGWGTLFLGILISGGDMGKDFLRWRKKKS